MTIQELKDLQNKVINKCKKINKIFYPIYIGVVLISLGILIYFKIYILLFHAFFLISVNAFIIYAIVKHCNISKDSRIFETEFHRLFVEASLKEVFKDAEFKEEGFSEEFIDSLGFIYTYDRFDSNDYVKGTYKNIKFEQADMHIEEEHESTDSDGHTSTTYVTMFLGRFMIYDFNKTFKSNISISTGGMAIDNLPRSKNFYRVKMEDSVFNKNFFVYSENEHDAFYLLTPHFMERIKRLYNDLKAGLLLYFVDNKLYIAVNNYEDAFEYNIMKPINEEEIKKNILGDINIILKFIEDLDLDNDLFKK